MIARNIAWSAVRIVREPIAWYFTTMMSVAGPIPTNPVLPLMLQSTLRTGSGQGGRRG